MMNSLESEDHNMLVPISELPSVVESGQCIGCGFCSIPLVEKQENVSVEYNWDDENEHWVPVVPKNANELLQDDLRVCPAKSMNMKLMAQHTFGRQPDDPIVGEALSISSGFASDPDIRKHAASGGITTALVSYLFQSDQIDACYCAVGRDPVNGKGKIVRSLEELQESTGSHYHPIAFGDSLASLVSGNERFVFIGLPCEVAAMRRLMAELPEMATRCVY